MDSIRFKSMSLSMFLLLVLVVGLIVFILLIEPRLSKKKIKNKNTLKFTQKNIYLSNKLK